MRVVGNGNPAKANHHLTYRLSYPIPIRALYSRCISFVPTAVIRGQYNKPPSIPKVVRSCRLPNEGSWLLRQHRNHARRRSRRRGRSGAYPRMVRGFSGADHLENKNGPPSHRLAAKFTIMRSPDDPGGTSMYMYG